MFYNDKWFKIGWLYFLIQFVLEIVLPDYFGDENGIIENLQMLWLIGGGVFSYRMCVKVGGTKEAFLWKAGVIFFFLLTMREISWGRAILHHADGRSFTYADMGLFGQLVHPLVGVLIAALLYYLYKARIARLLWQYKLPVKSFVLLLLFIFCSWVAERRGWFGYSGQVAEELAEFGAYMMMFVICYNFGRNKRS